MMFHKAKLLKILVFKPKHWIFYIFFKHKNKLDTNSLQEKKTNKLNQTHLCPYAITQVNKKLYSSGLAIKDVIRFYFINKQFVFILILQNFYALLLYDKVLLYLFFLLLIFWIIFFISLRLSFSCKLIF